MSLDRPKGGEQAVLVHIHFPAGKMQEDLAEFKALAFSAGADSVDVITSTRQSPESKYFVGLGKAEEIKASVKAHQAELVIFNHALSPAQERNLERLFQCRVVDRTGLILDIFAQRARSFEGKLQVELALLNHMSTRLVRGWTHLERQRGGIGLRGPGETQLEVDRRLIRKRIQLITKRLNSVRKQRNQSRRSRKKASLPTVALVGYTNAGKSTLFNYLTSANVYVADRLFATLDPTLRRVELPEVGAVILADTVGFIRHLPHNLIEAFRATLEEVREADLLLHVIDANDNNRETNMAEVQAVLKNIEADDVPQLLIYNKIDLCLEQSPSVDRNGEGNIRRVWFSAKLGLGKKELTEALIECLGKDIIQRHLILQPNQTKLRAQLFQMNSVMSEMIDQTGHFHLIVRLPKIDWEKIDFSEVQEKLI